MQKPGVAKRFPRSVDVAFRSEGLRWVVLGQVVGFFSVKYLRSVEILEIKEIPVYRKIQLYFHGGYKKCVS